MHLNHQTKIWLILISLWIINGSSFLAIKVAIDTIPPLLSAGLRFSISGAILFAAYFFQIKVTHHDGIRNLQRYQQDDCLYLQCHKNISLSNNGKTVWFSD